ncbi:C-type lectin domain family 2 member D11-like [Discoglossus pictus]
MEELGFVQHYKENHDYWIGLRREDDGNPWVWANGTLFNHMFRIEGVSPCVFLNSERISSAACYGDRKWVCNKLDRRAWKS